MSKPFEAMDEGELLMCVADEIRGLELMGETMGLLLKPGKVLLVIGALQLAQRHPNFPDRSRLEVRKVIEELAKQFDGRPAVNELVRRGWLREYDSNQ